MAAPAVRWMQRQGLTTKLEFSLPWGVCDLVGVKLDPDKTKRRIASGQTRSIGSFLRVLILSKVPDFEAGKSISVSRLLKQLAHEISPEILSKELDGLRRDRFISAPRSGFFQKMNGWAPLHTKIVAVELKLHRLSEAVDQAVSNRGFATHSYVAFPMHIALIVARSQRAEVLKRNGLGLLGVSPTRCLEVIEARAVVPALNPLVQTHVVERFWRTRGNLPSTASR